MEPLTQTRPDQKVFRIDSWKPELLYRSRGDSIWESNTRTRTWPRAKAGSFKQGKVGRRLKLIEVRQEEGKEIRTEVDAFVEVEAQDQITEVGTKRSGKSPLIADMPTPTTPVTQVGATRSCDSFSSWREKEKGRPVLCNRKPQKQFLFLTSDHPKKKWLKVLLKSEGKLPQTGTKEGGFFAWFGLLGLGFLRRRRQICSSQRVVHSLHRG